MRDYAYKVSIFVGMLATTTKIVIVIAIICLISPELSKEPNTIAELIERY